VIRFYNTGVLIVRQDLNTVSFHLCRFNFCSRTWLKLQPLQKSFQWPTDMRTFWRSNYFTNSLVPKVFWRGFKLTNIIWM